MYNCFKKKLKSENQNQWVSQNSDTRPTTLATMVFSVLLIVWMTILYLSACLFDTGIDQNNIFEKETHNIKFDASFSKSKGALLKLKSSECKSISSSAQYVREHLQRCSVCEPRHKTCFTSKFSYRLFFV